MIRGYSLSDVANEYVSKGQLSKFENGKSMLLSDGLMYAIEGLNLTMSEFFGLIEGKADTNRHQADQQLQGMIDSQDIVGIKGLITPNPRKTSDQMANIKAKVALYELTGRNQLTDRDYQFLDDYFIDSEIWTLFDIKVFDSCLSVLETELLYQISMQLLNSDQGYYLVANHTVSVKKTLTNVYIQLVIRGRLLYANEVEEQLSKLLSESDTETWIILHFFKKFFSQEGIRLELLEELSKELKYLKGLGAVGLVRELEHHFFKKHAQDQH